MDNFSFDISSVGEKPFKNAMVVALSQQNKCKGYKVHPKKGLMLYWALPDNDVEFHRSGITKLPYEMNLEQITDFCWGWLEATPIKDKKPDHDGDNDKGFHLYNEAWGHVDGDWRAFAAMEPIWAMYGK